MSEDLKYQELLTAAKKAREIMGTCTKMECANICDGSAYWGLRKALENLGE